MHQVDERTRAALTNAEISNRSVRITETLDADLWRSVARVLVRIGGIYQTNRSAFAFTDDPRPVLQALLVMGVHRKPSEIEGFVSTPETLAEMLTNAPYSDLARMPKGSRVLEPSAGDGPIVRAIVDANDEVEVVAVEPHAGRAGALSGVGWRRNVGPVTVVNTTFEEYAAGPGRDELFDAVVMNPPFSVPGRPYIWTDHVLMAWRLLEPGGRLVSVVPEGFTFNSGRAVTGLRQLVDDFGGWERLAPGTFRRDLKTCVIWLAKPIPGQEGRPPFVFRHYPDDATPARVPYPWLTTRAVREAPVQVWADPSWGRRDRVLRYRAQCWGCGWLLWEFDEDNDASLGNHSACTSLYAIDERKSGLSVGLCMSCRDTSKTREGALAAARKIWNRPPTMAAPVPVWSLLLNLGGMMPVDAVERERHARVQAAMRAVWGLDEHAPDEELIDARQAHPWRGGPDRLAAKYLAAYADRLDPDADLEPPDAAAMIWRSESAGPPIALADEPDPWGPALDEMQFLLFER